MRLVKKMKKNRFVVGSPVYLVYNKDGKYCVEDRLFMVNKVSEDESGFHYSLKCPSGSLIDWCYEDQLFLRREQAIKFAFTHNNNTGKAE